MKTIDVSALDEDIRFHVKLEIALRSNAKRIQELDSNPERFSRYIEERERKIMELLETDRNIQITEGGKQIFP